MAAYGVDRVVFCGEIGNEIIVKFDVYIVDIISFASCFAKFVELDNKPLVILNGGAPRTEGDEEQPDHL